MGYYASYEGNIQFKETPNEETINIINDVFGCSESENLFVCVYGYEKYYSDSVEEALYKIKDIVKNGEIDYRGDDGINWRYIFKDGEWNLEDGTIYYDSELPETVKKEDVPEFLGQVVDVFEDVLEKHKLGINEEDPILFGEVYDDAVERLDKLMKAWNIYK